MRFLQPTIVVAVGLCASIVVMTAGPGFAAANSAEELSLEQQQIAAKFRRLEQVLVRMAELTEGTDPRRAALLKKAVRQSGEQLIDVRFETLVELLRKDQLARAMQNQQYLGKDLQALLKLLMSEDRAKRIRSRKLRIREYLKRINLIIKQQKDIQGRTADSENPKPISSEQGRLADHTEALAKDIEKNEEADGKGQGPKKPPSQDSPQNEPSTRQRLETAQQRMKEAQDELDRTEREGAVEKQEEALRALQQAKAQLMEILRQLREEEIARMLAMLEARFRKMLQMQREVLDGTTRLGTVPKPQRSHHHDIEAGRLSGKESEIVVQCDKVLLLLHEDGTAVAFPEAVGQMRDDMQQVVLRLAEAKVGPITEAIEKDIIAALEEMIEALKKARKEMEDKKTKSNRPPGQPQDPPLVDLLSELRMIRALQMRINRRTQRYSELIEGEQAEDPDLIEALRRLADRERRVYRVTRDLEMGKNK